ncbi:hypothetical protein HanRHA438_Chr01g0004131 [Helianthus annuus]|nr:hypothetical protein HanRHA438_Chr01g0004131 [Helianthus annuus]
MRVQSSTNNIKYRRPCPPITGAGPHTSEWINEKGEATFVLLGLNGCRWLLARKQVSQSIFPFEGKSFGNKRCE